MIFQSRHPLYLLLEAVLSGYLSYALVHWLRRKGGHSLVNALSLVSASFFGLGMVLKNAIQGNEVFAGLPKLDCKPIYLDRQPLFSWMM